MCSMTSMSIGSAFSVCLRFHATSVQQRGTVDQLCGIYAVAEAAVEWPPTRWTWWATDGVASHPKASTHTHMCGRFHPHWQGYFCVCVLAGNANRFRLCWPRSCFTLQDCQIDTAKRCDGICIWDKTARLWRGGGIHVSVAAQTWDRETADNSDASHFTLLGSDIELRLSCVMERVTPHAVKTSGKLTLFIRWFSYVMPWRDSARSTPTSTFPWKTSNAV